MKGRVRSLKDNFNSDNLRQKIMQDERALAERRKSQKEAQSNNNQQNGSRASESSLLANGNNSHDALARDEEMGQHVQAQEMLQRQDETLDDLDHAVVRVGQMAGNIHDELQTQNKMLTSLEEDLSDAEEKLGMVMGKLAKLLKTKSKCQLGTIMLLSVTVIILFFLVIYT
jgi:syntaxin 6